MATDTMQGVTSDQDSKLIEIPGIKLQIFRLEDDPLYFWATPAPLKPYDVSNVTINHLYMSPRHLERVGESSTLYNYPVWGQWSMWPYSVSCRVNLPCKIPNLMNHGQGFEHLLQTSNCIHCFYHTWRGVVDYNLPFKYSGEREEVLIALWDYPSEADRQKTDR